MTKSEFLNELKSKLVGLPKDDIDNRIEFYGEMIDDRIEEGKTEAEAIEDIGTVDEIVAQIAKETPLLKLVKERVKPKRSLRAWEIVLLVLGFPLWFPLLVTGLVLAFVFYLLLWVFVLVAYIVEIALAFSSVASLVIFFVYLANGSLNLMSLGASIMCFGGAIIFIFACIGITKGTIKLSKFITLRIKTLFIRGDKK